MSQIQTKYRSCPLCEAICGLEIKVKGQEVVSIRGDEKDPLSRGHICPKAIALKDIHEDPDRLRMPIRKTEQGTWEQIGWEEAFEEVITRIKQIQEQHGVNAVGIYNGNPTVHNYGSMLFIRGLIGALKTRNRFSATSVDQLPHQLASMYMFGHDFIIPIPDIDRTDFWLIMGANPLASNGSMMTAPDVGKRIKAIQESGGKVVVVDPRFTETAAKADQHIFIRPGTDIWLLLAMLQQVLSQGSLQLGHLEELINKKEIEQLKSLVAPFTIEIAAAQTGVPESIIRNLIESFENAGAAVCYGRMGLSTVQFGGLSQWAINCINILTGNLDREGGAMFSAPAFDTVGNKPARMRFGRWKSRVRGLPEFGGELPSATLAEEILTPGEGQIRAMVTSCGNPVLSTPNGRQLDKAFESLEFMVSIDIYLNETTRHADIILPPATGLEVGHYDVTFLQLAIRNTAKYSAPVFEKASEAKYDWEIMSVLSQGLSASEIPVFSPEMILDHQLRKGSYELTFADLQANPHGVDLGPLQPRLPGRIRHTDGKIKLVPDLFVHDLERLHKSEKEEGRSLLLIGRRHLRSNNSWMHNSLRLVKGKNRCTLLIHPEDSKGMEDGQLVRVTSRTGSTEINIEITDKIMPGVVSIPHGWGHNREGIALEVAQAHSGVSANDLTDDQLVDELTGNAAVNGVPVGIELI